MHRSARKAASRALGHLAEFHGLQRLAGRRIAQLGEMQLPRIGEVHAPELQRLRDLVGLVGDGAVGAELAQQVRVVLAGGNRLGRVERGEQVVGRLAEHVAAERV
ncbi:hypothetical protein D3C85_867340 [compost metagenome]